MKPSAPVVRPLVRSLVRSLVRPLALPLVSVPLTLGCFMLGLLLSGAVAAADLSGTYTLKARGGQLVTRVKVNGQTVRGVIEIPNGSPIQLNGTARDNRAEGIATSDHGNGQFQAQLVGDTLELIISQDAGPNQPAVALPLQFQRSQ